MVKVKYGGKFQVQPFREKGWDIRGPNRMSRSSSSSDGLKSIIFTKKGGLTLIGIIFAVFVLGGLIFSLYWIYQSLYETDDENTEGGDIGGSILKILKLNR